MFKCLNKVKLYIVLSVAAVIFSSLVFVFTPYEKSQMTAIFQYGSGGDAVKIIQQRLQDLGYYSGNVDGIYGYGTYEGVRLFH